MQELINQLEGLQDIKRIMSIRDERDPDKKLEMMLNISPSDHFRITRNYWHLGTEDLTDLKDKLELSIEENLATFKIESL